MPGLPRGLGDKSPACISNRLEFRRRKCPRRTASRQLQAGFLRRVISECSWSVGWGFIPDIVMSETDGVFTPEVCFSGPVMETYAITTTTYQRRALFVRALNAELLVKTLFHYRDQVRYQLHGFVVMPEHLHVLLTPLSGQKIERCVQCIKGGFSHAVREQFGGEVWQVGFHEHRVRDGEDFRRQLGYIAANPEKRGLMDWAFVHAKFLERIDAMPARFER
jgi:putative transposase